VQSATVVEFGGPDVFRLLEQTDPVPGPGEVLISVEAADTLWLETMVEVQPLDARDGPEQRVPVGRHVVEADLPGDRAHAREAR